MLTTLAALTIASLAMQQTDTTFAVPAGASLTVNNFGGAIIVHAWNQKTMKVHAEHSRRGRVEITLVGSTVTVKAGGRQGAPSVVDMEITVPAATPLNLSGHYAEITVDGVTGPIRAETVEGEVVVKGGRGNITLSSIQGSVSLADASGRIELTSVNEDIDVDNVTGEIKIEATNGEVTMTRIRSPSVEAATINGDVLYDGTINDGGSYSFTSHNGDITVTIPEKANVSITGATANGDLDPSFELPYTGQAGKRRWNFKLGTGSARLEVESFQGDIQLRRPGEVEVDRQPKHNRSNDSNHEYNFDFDFNFDLKMDNVVNNVATYASDYAARYAKEYAPKYAKTYARMYRRTYRQYSH